MSPGRAALVTFAMVPILMLLAAGAILLGIWLLGLFLVALCTPVAWFGILQLVRMPSRRR